MGTKRLPPVDVGRVISGKYRVGEVIGRGGMSTVLMAKHLQLDVQVALKVLHPELVDNNAILERFSREARAAVKIQSEHAARVLDVGTVDSDAGQRLPFMVMEHLNGTDLATLLRREGPLAVTPCIEYLMECAEALAEAHARGLVHRDIKPANIFLAERDDGSVIVKLIDFGITKLSDADLDHALTSTREVIGSPRYMSPEQLRRSSTVDARCDIWSLGVTLYELLTGTPPFRGDGLADLHAAILERDPEALSTRLDGVPRALNDAVGRCLQKRPEDRFATVAELAEAIAPFGGRPAARSLEVIRRWDARAREQLLSLPDDEPLPATRREGASARGAEPPTATHDAIPSESPAHEPDQDDREGQTEIAATLSGEHAAATRRPRYMMLTVVAATLVAVAAVTWPKDDSRLDDKGEPIPAAASAKTAPTAEPSVAHEPAPQPLDDPPTSTDADAEAPQPTSEEAPTTTATPRLPSTTSRERESRWRTHAVRPPPPAHEPAGQSAASAVPEPVPGRPALPEGREGF